ncbi:MAG TPA: hypothetical protein VH677_00115, partial [Nitrososphaera sp.]
MPCPLKIENNQGLIFPSSITPISGTVNAEPKDKHFEILISDRNSNEILRKSLGSGDRVFTWDLRSKSNSYVESGCYTISLYDTAGGSREICSTEC